jgi:glycosyltransferase involved in cell wall biosynthesis
LPYRLYDLLTLKTTATRADAVVVSSRMEYEDAIEFGLSPKQLHIIPMGVDIPPRPALKETEADTNSPLKILFVGRLARVRRVELILQAVQKLSIPYTVTIVGGEEKTSSLSRTGYLDELRTLCQELGISERVTFTGPKPSHELPSYYRTADAFVYPSLYENFAQPILEAASYGIPVVATPVGVAPEIIEDDETGFLVSADPKTLSRALEQLADPSVRKNLGEKLKETVRNKFAWSRIMDQYMELYRSL